MSAKVHASAQESARGLLWCVFISLSLASGPAWARDVHVSPSGDDTAPGSLAQPWRSIARVNAEPFVAGDRILFEGGQAFAGTLELRADDGGTPAAPIVISSYGGGRATIDAGSGTGISVYNTAGIEVRDLAVRGGWDADTQSGSAASGIELYMDLTGTTRLPHVFIEDVEVHGFRNSGIQIGAWPDDATMGGFRDVAVERCEVHDNGQAGISSYGYWDPFATEYAHHGVVVRGCRVFSNRGLLGSTNNTGNGIVLGGVADALIEHCEAFDNGDLCDHRGGGPVGIWCWDSTRVVIQHCESHHNRTGAVSADGGGFDLDGGTTDSVLQYNYSHDNDGAGYLVYQFLGARAPLGRNVVRWNVSENDGRAHGYGGIYVGGGGAVRDNAFYGNTIFVSPAAGASPAAVRLDGIGVSNTFRNNLFVTTGGVPLLVSDSAYSATRVVFQGNAWFAGDPADWLVRWGATSVTSLAGLRGVGQERLAASDVGMDVDPRLTAPGAGGTIGDPTQLADLDAYRLLPDSPLADAGLDLVALFAVDPGSRDFYGNALPVGAALSIGASDIAGCTRPVGVGDTLMVARAGVTDLAFTWGGVAGATSHVVREERALPGPFATVTGGTTLATLTAPMPVDALVFYRVAAVNACGEGP